MVCNHMQELVRRLSLQLASRVSTVEVEERNMPKVFSCCDDGAHQMFMSAMSGELPFGKSYGSTVLDLVAYPHRWRAVPYLCFCVLGLDSNGGGRELVLASIDVLLYRLVPNPVEIVFLVDAFEIFGGDGDKSLRAAWAVHEVKADSEGFVPDATFGSGGRVDYYIIAGPKAFVAASGTLTTPRIGIKAFMNTVAKFFYIPEP